MKSDTARLIFFSPTKTTLKVVDAIGQGLGMADISRMDMTLPLENTHVENKKEGLVVIGTPVYSGRVPELAAKRLRQTLQGNGRPAVVVVVYGNRAYDDALLELRNLAEELGCFPIAAAAFIGEHSFSTSEFPVAPGRPDEKDLQKARSFGRQVREKVGKIVDLDQLQPIQVAGNFPYRKGVQPAPISPDTDKKLCTLCGECARVCPSQVVSVSDIVQTDKIGCLRCGACIKACPVGARFWDLPRIHEINVSLHTNHGIPKKPEIFL